MNKKSRSAIGVAATIAVTLSMTACDRPHVHDWGDWQRTETEHYRMCSGCDEVQSGSHENFVCDDCALFKAVAFGTVDLPFDEAHVDFALEANEWFGKKGKELGFIYEFTKDWNDLNDEFLSDCDLVMFLNDKPGEQAQQQAFERYMENGGAWIGYHVCAFTTDAQNEWAWYHNEFLRSGNFRTNTWNPTSEILKVETHDHYSTVDLPDTFESAPNEWYGWQNDLRDDPNITVLLSLDESTFPAGDKPGEMWYDGYFPVAWTNDNYNMLYVNMGHNLMYYNTYEKQSETFSVEAQNKFILNAIFGLAA